MGQDERSYPRIDDVYSGLDESWRDEALCKDTDTELWFPNRGTSTKDIEMAKAICNQCPVQMPCLGWALDTGERWGIFGGYTERERRRWRKVLRPKLRSV